MKKNTFKTLLFLALTFFSLCAKAQDAPPSDDVFRIRNVETGLYLTDTGIGGSPVTMASSGDVANALFTLVQSGSFYNIDSEISGVLRAPGAGGPGGAFVVVSTAKASPSTDADKTWTIQHNQTDDTYRFQSRTSGRFMYHNPDGTITHIMASATDNRSNWELIPFVQAPVEVAPDEDTNTDLSCQSSGEFENNNTRNVDVANPANVGTADDRTCYSDYSESNVNGKDWGIYNITDGSNHWDAPNTLQPRIERSLTRSRETGVGSFARFTGTFRILEVGDAGSFSQDGTYIAQAKGKHSGGGGSRDPAICLYRAHPVYGTGINADKQVAFDIYAERVLERGGEGSSGREVVFLKRVNKNEEVDFVLDVGFRADPSDNTKKIHYCDAVIGGEAFNYNIPEPERGLESGIRYGVYRVRGGRAQIRWANTTYQREEVVDNSGAPSSDEIFRLRNAATGQFLTAVGSSADPVTMTDSGETQNTYWTFVESGSFFNIDSETVGVLRAPGANFSEGPYRVVSTGVAAPSSDNDKTWRIEYNDVEDTYRFESRTAGRYLYQQEDGSVTHSIASESDTRSVWEVISTNQVLSVSDQELKETSITIYPNPTNANFTIALGALKDVTVEIYNVLGKKVYEKQTNQSKLNVENNTTFTSGIYLIKATDQSNKVYHSKLVIK